jgi:uncharacterized protein
MTSTFWQATGLLVLYMRQGLKLDYLWAALCLVAAVYFVFRKS